MHEKAPAVAILVLNWNGAEVLGACLASLQHLNYPNYQVWVVDNASTDDSVKENEERFPSVRWVKLTENLGFAGGNNAGLKVISQTNDPPEYVVFLNNDTEVEPDFLEPLVSTLQRMTNAGAASPKILYADSRRIWYGGGIVNLWTGFIGHRRLRQVDSSEKAEPEETDYLTGCCLAMPYSLARELGPFDEHFNMYGEDVDLSLRLRQRGYGLYYVPGSRIYHKVSSSYGHAFSWAKLRRKGLGLIKLYRRWVRWYQWPTLILSQMILAVYYGLVLLIVKVHK